MKKEEILANCLEEIQSGKSTITECIANHPELREELRSLLEVASLLKPDAVEASIEFKQIARWRLFEEMQASSVKDTQPARGWPKLAAVRALAFVLIGLLVVGVGGSGTVFAAQGSLPGDTLYPVKTGFEDFRLAITPGLEAKANLHLEIAQTRIEEAAQQVKLNRNVDAQALQTVERQFDDVIKELGNSADTEKTARVLDRLATITLDQQLNVEQVMMNAPDTSQTVLKQTLDVARRGNLIAQVAHTNRDFLQRQPSVTDEKLDTGQFKIDGTLLNITGRTWNVGGVIIQNVYLPGEEPSIGSGLKIEGIVQSNETFISKITVSEVSNQSTTVEGQVGVTNPNGTTDIGGISVNLAESSGTQLESGNRVQVQSDSKGGQMNVTSQENQQGKSKDTISIKGILTAVDAGRGTVSVKTSGNPVIVNIGKARIENGSGQTLKLSDLTHLVGQGVSLEDLHKTGDIIFAQLMKVGEKD